MITVVHLITKLELGGAQENTLYTCQHLDRERFRVVLVYGPGGLLDEDARKLPNTTLFELPTLLRSIDPLSDLRCVEELRALLVRLLHEHRSAEAGRAQGADDFIIHTHSSKAGILGRLAGRTARVPHVVHTIHGFGFHPGQNALVHAAFEKAERTAARFTHAFIGVARASIAEAQARGIIGPRHRVELIRSGMNLKEFDDLEDVRQPARQALGLEPADEAIVCIANFKPQKDPLTLVKAMELLVRDRPQARLLFAGDGELRPEVEREIERRDLAKRVSLLGWRRDIGRLLAASDIVALSSIFEGLPRTAVQAVAARRPFVGTRVDGTPEIIREGRNGFLVEPQNPALLAKAMRKALELRPTDPEDMHRVLAWDADKMVRDQEALYLHLVQRQHHKSRSDRS